MSSKPKSPAASQSDIRSPAGFAIAGFAVLYIALIPAATYLAKPGGIAEQFLGNVLPHIPLIKQDRIIPALAAFYTFYAFGFTAALSVAGQAVGIDKPFDNDHPRLARGEIKGFPHRLHAAHQNIIENFPAFPVTAALAQILAPKSQILINLLTVHVIGKTLVFYPSYLLNISPLRTLSHVVSLSAVFGGLWELAKGAK